MELVTRFRENTRRLERKLAAVNQADCCCFGISTLQCYILVEIGRNPGISLKELAQIVKVDKSGVSRAVEDLVQKDYIERESSKKDRRWIVLRLKEKGKLHYQKIETDMNIKFQKILEAIPKEKQMIVIEMLELFRNACESVEENENDT